MSDTVKRLVTKKEGFKVTVQPAKDKFEVRECPLETIPCIVFAGDKAAVTKFLDAQVNSGIYAWI